MSITSHIVTLLTLLFVVCDVFTGAAPKPYVTILEKKGELECEVPGAYPKPTVEWWDSDNKTLPSKTLQDRQEQDRFHVIIQATAPKSGCYRCVATQMNIWHQISSKICVHEGEWWIILQINVRNKI